MRITVAAALATIAVAAPARAQGATAAHRFTAGTMMRGVLLDLV